MKRNYKLTICTLAFIFVAQFTINAATATNDTTIVYKNKLVKISDNADQIKVKVLDAKRPNDTTAYKQLYEGIFSDGKSYETWSVMESIGIQLPTFGKNKSKRNHHSYSMDPHYAGFGIGFAGLIDQRDKRSTEIPLKADETTEWFINFIEHSYPIYRNRLALVTGFGINWRTYNVQGNKHLVDHDGNTTLDDVDPKVLTYSISRLKVTHLTMPLLIEWQPGWIRNGFLSGGVEAGIKTYSSYRVKYTNVNGDSVDKIEAHGLNTNPLSLDVMAKAGIDNISIFAKYGLVGVFTADTKYDVRPVSIGIMLNF